MKTAPLMRNATFKHETANPFVSDLLVPLGHVVRQTITGRLALAITHFKAMAIPHVCHVR